MATKASRKKTLNNVADQAARLRGEIYEQLRQTGISAARKAQLEARLRNVNATADRYEGNIKRTKSYQKHFQSGLRKLESNLQKYGTRGAFRGIKEDSMAYSQRTYMGMSNG